MKHWKPMLGLIVHILLVGMLAFCTGCSHYSKDPWKGERPLTRGDLVKRDLKRQGYHVGQKHEDGQIIWTDRGTVVVEPGGWVVSNPD